jgi:hypothetical protein
MNNKSPQEIRAALELLARQQIDIWLKTGQTSQFTSPS